MTLHLVTAAQAEDHISSSDDARLYEAFVGSGGIVFSQGNKMSASMTDPNTMRIMDGVALLCGRYWNITNYEEVTITNGTPGMNSIALVVANIKTDPSEAVTLKVYEGVETEGEPVMPSYIEGDLNGGDTEAEMPLYAVTKTGLSVGDPMPQFEVFLSEKKFRDSISPVVLFDNDDNPVYNDIVLLDSAANYSLLVIEGKDLDGFYCYAMAFDPDGKTVVLETTRCTSATWFHLNSRCVAISGNTIKTSKVNNSSWGETAQINLTENNIANHINVITITKVLGFK